ncbi:MAG: acyltransferase family protein [Janthinobacterium lividum]
MKKKFVGLDILRFGLAIYLMVYHTIHSYPDITTLPFNELLGLGGAATSSFFILSGFILAHVYFGTESTVLRGGARDFLIKRLSNLYPLHIISLGLFLVVILCGGGSGSLGAYSQTAMGDMPGQIVHLGPFELFFNRILALLMLDTWNPLYVTLNPPAWSLSVLMFFYLCFPFLAPRLLSAPRQGRALLLIWLAYLVPPVIAGAMQWYGPAAVGLISANPVLRLPEFMAGIVFYGMYRNGALAPLLRVQHWKHYVLGFVVVSFISAAWLTAHGALFWTYIVHNGAMLPAELLLLLVFAQSMEGSSPRVTRWAARLGNASLSIFALHLSLFFIFVKLEKLFGTGMSPLACFQQRGLCIAAYKAAPPLLAAYPLYLIATVFAAIYFQEVIVVKVRDALRARLLAPRVVARPAPQSVSGAAAPAGKTRSS